MTCADAEILICDHIDGTLDAARKAELAQHLFACSECAALARDAGAAVAFMERAAEVQPPPELVTKILFEQPWRQRVSRTSGVRSWFGRLLQPVLQPRLAMGMAMTILSLAVLAKFVAPAKQLTAADFQPAKVWASLDDRIYRGYQRTVKFYESIKFVYQIRSRLQEWSQQQDEEQAAEQSQKRTDEKKLPVKNAPAPGTEAPQRSR